MITIIDYKAGNLTSVRLAFDALGVETQITDAPEKILAADKIVFPGVGAAGAAMHNLKALNLIEPIKKQIKAGVPFLGICLGMQILFNRSAEDGGTVCLGILDGEVKRFVAPSNDIKIPQMGWNSVSLKQKHPLFKGIENHSEFYFVHGYYPITTVTETIYGVTDYAGVTFTSIVGRNNLLAMQFHPEKSGRIGLTILNNFSKWDGKC
ncbi:MAG: imidazole glycerol phosphate synthase subunit HisH [Dehalococcoidales bacterium]|nr:imidazole glycerol phosphate synthase subunit HisH [Dehalococcoidales bacterium]